VVRITTDGRGGASGVVLADGSTIRSRWVVPACDASVLYGSLLPPVPAVQRFHRRVMAAETSYSAFTIYVGLDCDARELGLGEEMLRVIAPGVPRRELSRGNPATTMISLLAPSVRDPSLAPPGKGTLAIHCPAYIQYESNWRTGKDLERGPAYRALKEQFTATIMDRLEREAIPGLRQHVEVIEAATPVTYWRYTGNRDGCLLGFRPNGRNIRSGVARHRGPIANLYVAGQWSEYGGGIPIAVKAAANAALLVLREANPDSALALQDVMDERV
jgi:prolycopene isomerase